MAIPNISEIRDGKRVIVKKPELLLPAGNLEKLKIAIHYGSATIIPRTPASWSAIKNSSNPSKFSS